MQALEGPRQPWSAVRERKHTRSAVTPKTAKPADMPRAGRGSMYKRISGSYQPPFLLVSHTTAQSTRVPPYRLPDKEPTKAATNRKPICCGLRLYGGAENTMPVKASWTMILPGHQHRPGAERNTTHHISPVPNTREVKMTWGSHQECMGWMNSLPSDSLVGVKSWSLK